MANKPLRPCLRPGCTELTRSGYCEAHKLPAGASRKESELWRHLYRTPLWRRLRAAQLLHWPWCVECAKIGLRVRAAEVDHIVPHRGDMSLFADPGNLQSLCKRHHSAKTMREINESRKRSKGAFGAGRG